MHQSSNINRPVTIYISAAADLMAEREALGRMIATLPITLAWRIVQTPLGAELLDLEAVRQADLYLLLLGSDIRAPIGLEWYTAHYARRPIHAFLKQGLARTPAGQTFVREVNLAWQPFTTAVELSKQVERALAEHLIHNAVHYSLSPAELTKLSALPPSDTKTTTSAKNEDTGHSAVILSRERFMPGDGILVDGS